MEPFRLYGSERLSRQAARSPFPPRCRRCCWQTLGGLCDQLLPGQVILDRAVVRDRRGVASHRPFPPIPVRSSVSRWYWSPPALTRVFSESILSHARAIRRLIRGVRDPIGRHPHKLGIRGLHADRPDPRGPRRRAVRPGRLHAHIVPGRRRGGARLHGDLRVRIADGEIGRRRRLGTLTATATRLATMAPAHKSTRSRSAWSTS